MMAWTLAFTSYEQESEDPVPAVTMHRLQEKGKGEENCMGGLLIGGIAILAIYVGSLVAIGVVAIHEFNELGKAILGSADEAS